MTDIETIYRLRHEARHGEAKPTLLGLAAFIAAFDGILLLAILMMSK